MVQILQRDEPRDRGSHHRNGDECHDNCYAFPMRTSLCPRLDNMYKGANDYWALERLFFPTTILLAPVLGSSTFHCYCRSQWIPLPGPSFPSVSLPEQAMPDRVVT